MKAIWYPACKMGLGEAPAVYAAGHGKAGRGEDGRPASRRTVAGTTPVLGRQQRPDPHEAGAGETGARATAVPPSGGSRVTKAVPTRLRPDTEN
jgi:hypothetical protein